MPRHCLDGTKTEGRGPTEGLSAARYEAKAPDGSLLVKRSFKCTEPDAFIGLYHGLDRQWHVTGVSTDAAALKNYSDIVVPARRRS